MFLIKLVIVLYWFAVQYHYPQTSTVRIKNKTHFILNLVQIDQVNFLLLKTTVSSSKFDMINKRLKHV